MTRKQSIGDTVSMVVATNKDAAKQATALIAGNIINDRIIKIVAPKLPMFARGYANTELGEAAMANLFAAVLVHVMPDNERVLLAADCMIKSAAVKLASSFNIEGLISELLDGIMLPTVEGE